MLTEREMEQITTTLEYAAFPHDDDKAVFVNDVWQILGGYVEKDQEPLRPSDFPRTCSSGWVHQVGPT